MACGSCGGRSGGAQIQYEVKANNGQSKTVATTADARLFLATNGGGTFKSVPKTK